LKNAEEFIGSRAASCPALKLGLRVIFTVGHTAELPLLNSTLKADAALLQKRTHRKSWLTLSAELWTQDARLLRHR